MDGAGARSARGQRGQAITEFTVVAPVFLLVLFGIFDVGRVIWATDSLAGAAREAARFAIVHGGWPNTACPVGPPAPEARIPEPSDACPYPSPSKQMIVDVALDRALAAGVDVTVTVCYGAGCSGDSDVVGATNARGTPVTVAIDSDVPLVAGSFLGLGSFHVHGDSTMLVNN